MAIYGDGKHNENMEHVSKQEFDFYIDRKVTMWVREYHKIKADTLDEAKTKMINSFKEDYYDDTFDERESLYDTESYMEPGDNDGQPTAELFYNDELLTTNTGECWECCDWVAIDNDSAYSNVEVCRMCGQKRKN